MTIPKPRNPLEKMIDQACGVKLEEHEQLFVKVKKYHPIRGVMDVVDASIDWWESKRPVSWTKEQHIENPTINCMNITERVLAEKIALVVKNGW